MAIKEDVQKRAPRGTKNVTQAFFAALDDIADGQQAVVGAAALAAIRDELKGRRVKIKEAAAAAKAKTKAPAKRKAPARAKAAAKVAAKAPVARGARKAAPAKRAPAAAAAGKRAVARKTPAKKVVARKARQPKQADQAVSPSAETAAE
jgi:hypothetical protein